MTDRDRLAADLHAIEDPDIGNGPSLRQKRLADRLIALGWTRLDEGLVAVCEKCSGTSIGVRWDKSYFDCLYREQERRDWPRDGGEHLHHCCRTCRWTWAAAIAKAYREDTLDEERLARALGGDFVVLDCREQGAVKMGNNAASRAIAKAYREDTE